MAVVYNVGRWSSGSVSVFKQGEFLSLPEREPRRSRGVLRIALGPHFSNPPRLQTTAGSNVPSFVQHTRKHMRFSIQSVGC